jgi:hypothetical protein
LLRVIPTDGAAKYYNILSEILIKYYLSIRIFLIRLSKPTIQNRINIVYVLLFWLPTFGIVYRIVIYLDSILNHDFLKTYKSHFTMKIYNWSDYSIGICLHFSRQSQLIPRINCPMSMTLIVCEYRPYWVIAFLSVYI